MDGWMDGSMDVWMDGQMGGRTDGWMDGWMDGWTDFKYSTWNFILNRDACFPISNEIAPNSPLPRRTSATLALSATTLHTLGLEWLFRGTWSSRKWYWGHQSERSSHSCQISRLGSPECTFFKCCASEFQLCGQSLEAAWSSLLNSTGSTSATGEPDVWNAATSITVFRFSTDCMKKLNQCRFMYTTLSLPRVFNFRFPVQPHQKYYITQYGELCFS